MRVRRYTGSHIRLGSTCGSRPWAEDTLSLTIGFRICLREEPIKKKSFDSCPVLRDRTSNGTISRTGGIDKCKERHQSLRMCSESPGVAVGIGVWESAGMQLRRIGGPAKAAKIVLGIGDKAKSNNTRGGFSSHRQQHVAKYLKRIVQQQIRTLGHASTKMGLATIGTTASSNNNGLSKINEALSIFRHFAVFVVSERRFVRVQPNWLVKGHTIGIDQDFRRRIQGIQGFFAQVVDRLADQKESWQQLHTKLGDKSSE
ncbi:unnamed protein product [Caenorhabditis brenneri]